MKQLDPKAVWLFFFNNIILWLIQLAVLVISLVFLLQSLQTRGILILDFNSVFNTTSGSLRAGALIFIPMFIILRYVWARLVYHFYRYELLDVALRKERGILYKRYVSIPYNRVQNVDISRSILERILGLSTLQIQTAGKSGVVGAESVLPGLSQEIAESLRDELIKRASQNKNQGL